MSLQSIQTRFEQGSVLLRNVELSVEFTNNTLTVKSGSSLRLCFELLQLEDNPMLCCPQIDAATGLEVTLAAIEAAFLLCPHSNAVYLVNASESLAAALLHQGAALSSDCGLVVLADIFWQLPGRWIKSIPSDRYPFYLQPAGDQGVPMRPPLAEGLLYARYIPWMGREIQLHVADIERDLLTFNGWMNDPRVAAFWEESGDLEYHRRFLSERLADPRVIPVIAFYDEVPFAYFEVYWAKEDRIAPHCHASDFDRGFHLLIGNEAFRGRSSICAWFPSLVHFMFLDDCRTRRLVAEPRADNQSLLRCSDGLGFERVYDFDFPHKRATLISLDRADFFASGLHLSGRASIVEAEVKNDEG